MQHSPKTEWPHETRCQAKRVRLNSCMWRFVVWFSWSCCCAGRSARRSWRSWCFGTSWRSCVGGRGECRFDPSIARSWPRSRGRCREARGRVCRCVRRRCCAGTVSWSGEAGPIRAGGRGGRRSIVASRRWLFDSHARTRPGAIGGSSANCEASASRSRRPRCARSSSVMCCCRRRRETSSPGGAFSASTRRRRSPAISLPSRPPG
jgi:hypothetical protein